MAKLAIYRGGTLEREVELGPGGARIGRGDQNDIVLPDPAKSVSRFHAELRFDNGRYTIVDLNSQNGTWVAGKRVPQAALEPGTAVVMGSYRLVFVAEPAFDAEMTIVAAPPVAAPPVAAPPVAAPPSPAPAPPALVPPPLAAAPASPPLPAAQSIAPASPGVEASLRVPPMTPAAPPIAAAAPAVPPRTAAAPVPADSPGPPPPLAEPAAAAPAAPKASPPAPPAASTSAAPHPATPSPVPAPALASPAKAAAAPKPAPPPAKAPAPLPSKAVAAPAKKGPSRALMFGGLAILVLAAAAAGLFLWPVTSPAPSSNVSAGQPSASPAALPGAAPDAATPQALPGAPPADASPQPAASAASAVPSAPVPPPGATEPASAPAAGASLPAASPASPPAGGAATSPLSAAQKVSRPAAPAASSRPRKDSAAAARRPVEPKPRALNLPQVLQQSRAAMARGDYRAAIAGFESVLKADPKYPEATELLRVAQEGAQKAVQTAIEAGGKAEASGDYAAAARQYERAQQLDPGSAAPLDAMKGLRARMRTEGEDAFKRGKQFDAIGRTSEAAAMYEKALRLLPADHPSAATAKERLAALRGGN